MKHHRSLVLFAVTALLACRAGGTPQEAAPAKPATPPAARRAVPGGRPGRGVSGAEAGRPEDRGARRLARRVLPLGTG